MPADPAITVVDEPVTVTAPATGPRATQRPAGVSRWVDQRGQVSLGGFRNPVGATFAGELVEVLHAGVLVATHAQRLKVDRADLAPRAVVGQRWARDATTGLTVTRLADISGTLSFASAADGCGGRGPDSPSR